MAERSASRPRSLGILGGTFNPPHLGHVAVARHARDELALERVLLVPAHTSPFKSAGDRQGGGDPGPEHRLRMCQLAVEGEHGLSVCALEVERGGLSYTVDTLRSIHASNPDAELTFIVGADTASTLGSWREPAQLLELMQLAVATRAGAPRRQVLDALAGINPVGAGAEGRAGEAPAGVRFLEMAPVAVSSSQARERAARGESIDALVGPAVAGYIAEHRLYAKAGAVAGR
ncbi:MAG TPA: nicotinate (nicotinamide) nucleotide adenylyltransferase [Solirubrobacteraceae bacterium]|nr:nicotinate (nicotinamide) nucleotide adenylyltransferase [Solirubrobacteraceae bacterium]